MDPNPRRSTACGSSWSKRDEQRLGTESDSFAHRIGPAPAEPAPRRSGAQRPEACPLAVRPPRSTAFSTATAFVLRDRVRPPRPRSSTATAAFPLAVRPPRSTAFTASTAPTAPTAFDRVRPPRPRSSTATAAFPLAVRPPRSTAFSTATAFVLRDRVRPPRPPATLPLAVRPPPSPRACVPSRPLPRAVRDRTACALLRRPRVHSRSAI